MKNKTLCIVQARMGSTRLSGKVLMKLGNISSLEYQVRRLRMAKKVDKIVVATTSKKEDLAISNLCEKRGIDCFRGSELDVLDRLFQCAQHYPAYRNIIRTTADCPLIDPQVVDKVIATFESNVSLDYASNILNRTYPQGMDTEIFTRDILEKTARDATLDFDREHVTEYMFRNRKIKKQNVKVNYDFSHFRLTVDYQEDLEVIRFLVRNSNINSGYLHYISLLTKNPAYAYLNVKYNIDKKYLKDVKNFLTEQPKNFMGKKVIVVILGGAIVKQTDGKWRTANFNEGDNFGESWDRLTIEAAKCLYKKNKDMSFIVLGGRGQNKNIFDAPAVSKVVKSELVEIGIPEKKIITEINSGNTYQQLLALKNFLINKKEYTVLLISGEHHLPRIKAMIEHRQDLLKLKKLYSELYLKIRSAESILIEEKPAIWRLKIDKAMRSSGMKKRNQLEKQGIKQIKEGTYVFK